MVDHCRSCDHGRQWSTIVDTIRQRSTIVDHGRPWSVMVDHLVKNNDRSRKPPGRSTMFDHCRPLSCVVDHCRPWSNVEPPRTHDGNAVLYVCRDGNATNYMLYGNAVLSVRTDGNAVKLYDMRMIISPVQCKHIVTVRIRIKKQHQPAIIHS